jgi:hypothetical protein
VAKLLQNRTLSETEKSGRALPPVNLKREKKRKNVKWKLNLPGTKK